MKKLKIPQKSPEKGTEAKETQNVRIEPLKAPQQPLPQQKPPPQRCLKPQTSQGTPVSRRTRSQQKAGDPQNIGETPLPPLTPEESKKRDNNFSHMTHLREAMKTGIEKWNKEIRKEKDKMRKAWMEAQKETLVHWLEDIEKVLRFADTATTYIPTVKEAWITAVQLKPSTTLEDPGNPPNKPTDPTPARKHMAKKSGAGRQRTAGRTDGLESDPQKELGGQPRKPGDEPKEDRKTSPGTKPKGAVPPGTKPKGPVPPGTKPKSPVPGMRPKRAVGSTPKGVKPTEPVPKNTTGMTLGSQSTWYKSGVPYDTK